MSRAHSPTFPSLDLRHSSFSNPSVALPTSQLILQPFSCFTYVTAHSPTLLSLLLRHRFSTYVTWRAAHDVNNGWDRRGPWSGIYLFTRGHMLHLSSETVAVLRRMNDLDKWCLYDTRGRMWPKFPDICIAVDENRGKTSTRNLSWKNGYDVTFGPQRWSGPLIKQNYFLYFI